MSPTFHPAATIFFAVAGSIQRIPVSTATLPRHTAPAAFASLGDGF
jgi:hypothetical protein